MRSGVNSAMMKSRIDKAELIQRAVARSTQPHAIAEEVIDATLDEIYTALKNGECVSLKNFGTFYVRPERESWVFKFNPAQRLRKLFGWSSTYTGDL
jgi:DNA-binding protein HU-beta